MKEKNLSKYCLILIFLSLIISIVYSNYNIKHFDKNIIDKSGSTIHLMIKNDALRYFSHGYEIKNDLQQGISYFETGRNNFTKYLYPRLIALYYLIFDHNIYENPEKKIIKIGIHSKFLYIQIIAYYFSLLFLYSQLSKKIEKKYLIFSLLFLALEPTLFQYHGSFWSESYFFTFQILILSLMINNNFSNFRVFIIGVLISFLAFQRSNGLYYLLPVIIYFYFSKDFIFFKKIIYLLFGFILLPIFIGYHNFNKTNKFSILPLETKSVLHAYVIPNILTQKELDYEKNKFFEIVEKEKFSINIQKFKDLNYSRYSFIFCDNVSKIEYSEKLKICEYFDKRSKEIILSNPSKFITFFVKKSLSFALLNPFHIFSDHKYLSGEEYYQSKLHKNLLIPRIIYTILIYFICIMGLINIYQKKEYKLLMLVMLSSIYFFLILSWHGNNRYFTPVLIYLSIFFGYGVNFILKMLKKNY